MLGSAVLMQLLLTGGGEVAVSTPVGSILGVDGGDVVAEGCQRDLLLAVRTFHHLLPLGNERGVSHLGLVRVDWLDGMDELPLEMWGLRLRESLVVMATHTPHHTYQSSVISMCKIRYVI